MICPHCKQSFKNNVSAQTIQKIKRMNEDGISLRKTAAALGNISHSTVCRVLKNLKSTHNDSEENLTVLLDSNNQEANYD